MKTLKDIAIERKSRKGAARATTPDGAYWLPIRVKLMAAGGDGIGQSAASHQYYLTVRHYRSGDVRAYVEDEGYHQNNGSWTVRTRCSEVLDATNHEELLIALKKSHFDPDDGEPYRVRVSELGEARLEKEIPELPDSPPAPDEDGVR